MTALTGRGGRLGRALIRQVRRVTASAERRRPAAGRATVARRRLSARIHADVVQRGRWDSRETTRRRIRPVERQSICTDLTEHRLRSARVGYTLIRHGHAGVSRADWLIRPEPVPRDCPQQWQFSGLCDRLDPVPSSGGGRLLRTLGNLRTCPGLGEDRVRCAGLEHLARVSPFLIRPSVMLRTSGARR